jgi:sulfur-carrier protein
MPRVFVPPLLRPLTGGAETLDVAGDTVRQAIADLDRQYPGLQSRLCDGDGLKPGLTVAVDGHVRSLGLLQRVKPDSEIHFLPAIGGG